MSASVAAGAEKSEKGEKLARSDRLGDGLAGVEVATGLFTREKRGCLRGEAAFGDCHQG